MNRYYKIILIVTVIFISSKIYAQSFEEREAAYHKYANLYIDSVSNEILTLKNNLNNAILHNDSLQIADNNFFLGLIYYNLSSFDIAIEYDLKALKLYQALKDTIFTFYTSHNISACYGIVKNDKISLEYSLLNFNLANALNDTIFIIGSNINLGASYIGAGQVEQGKKHYEYAMKLATEINDKDMMLYVYNNIATLYFNDNKIDSAEIFYLKSLSMTDESTKGEVVATIYSNIAETEYNLHNYKLAFQYAQKSIKCFSDIYQISEASSAYQFLIKSAVKLNKKDSLIKYLDEYFHLQEEIINKKKAEEIAKMQILYEVNKYEAQIKNLITENKLKEVKLAQSRLRFALSIVVIFLILSILTLFVIQNIRIKKSHQKIVQENIKSLKYEEENLKLKQAIEQQQKTVNNINAEDQTEEQTDKKLLKQIISYLDKNKPYTNPDFSLNLLAKELNTNRTYISRAINNVANKSFVEFINEYRVTEAKKLLCSPENKQLTIEAIGEKAGFKSKSTFFRVFKTVTGVTPSFFLKNIDSKI